MQMRDHVTTKKGNPTIKPISHCYEPMKPTAVGVGFVWVKK